MSQFSLEVPGIVIKNLIPDDVKVSVGVLMLMVYFNFNNQSNLEVYKKKWLSKIQVRNINITKN
ncbi:hypothetical protein [Mycoplasma bradburyae]|uniref:hypothetical protein n=1 Tax=Mycoplasma bradburyae TaxID=2963128 RepID=UPI00233FBAE7|nr:hypothetical protein [Mycoplasma bradburyae]MDC4182796.1 hypothetical protein [Mycoplasma bradburyae]